MAHRWKFFRAGGFDQVRIDSGADIAHLGELDQKLWVALACPAQGLEFDPHTLTLLDDDQDGRIRAPEVLRAVSWTCSLLKNPDDLLKGSPELPLDAIHTETEEGRNLVASAKQVLANLGKPEATRLSPDDVADTAKLFAKTLFNGDGVLPPEAAEADAATAQALKDIASVTGAVKDVSGLDGVDQAHLDTFFQDAAAYLTWAQSADAALDASAFETFRVVKAKAEDYFTRCGLAAMDTRATVSLNPAEATYATLATQELGPADAGVSHLPLARIAPQAPLPLREGLNPAWATPVGLFRDRCVTPLLGARNELTVEEWHALEAKLAAAQAWYAGKPVLGVEKLGTARLQELTQPAVKAAIDALMAKDRALEPELKAITSVNRLAHYFRDLARFLNNFVAFRDFYTHQARATFQAGTLFLDGRACDLVLRVDDPGKHGVLAGLSSIYLAYCDLTRKGSTEKVHVVAAFTDGDADFLVVGRNGLFYDRLGQDWDATIVKIIDQPISVRQAFWTPYKKVASFVENQINAFAGSRAKESDTVLTGAVADVTKEPTPGTPAAAAAKPAPAPSGFDIGKFAGVFAAIGLAVGMVGSALASVFTGFLRLQLWQMPLVLAGAALVVSGPSMLLAAMKLRKRNLGPLLDASGWAINSRAKINIPFGASLTQVAELPKGSDRTFADPYASKRRGWPGLLTLLVILGGAFLLYRSGLAAKGWAALQQAHTASGALPDAGVR